MKIHIIHGYNDEKRHRVLEAGIHDIDETDFAQYLIDTGHATPMDLPFAHADAIDDEEEEDAIEITMTDPAKEAMALWGLTVEDFEGVKRITKPMVDAVIAQRVHDEEDNED